MIFLDYLASPYCYFFLVADFIIWVFLIVWECDSFQLFLSKVEFLKCTSFFWNEILVVNSKNLLVLPRPSDLTTFQFPFIHSQIIYFRTSPQFLLLFLYWLVIFPTEFLLKILRFFYPQGHDKPNFLAPTLPPSQMLMLCDSFQGFVSICLYPGLMEEAKLSNFAVDVYSSSDWFL